MMKYNYYDLINQGHILGGLIDNFDYPEKICPYCFKPLVPVQAIHWVEDKFQYKSLYFCSFAECPVYDEGAKKAYARIYYSSEQAYVEFCDVQMPVQRWEQEDVVSIYK